MYCKKCGKQISDNSIYCKYCGSKQDEQLDSKDIANDVSSTNDAIVTTKKQINNHKKRNAIIAVVLIAVLIIAVVLCVNAERNAFKSPIDKDSFTFEYNIKDDRIDVEITAKVDIKNFKFMIFCYREDNILHQYSERYEESLVEKGSILRYTILMSDVVKENPWLETWKLDKVRISEYSGMIRNKDKK